MRCPENGRGRERRYLWDHDWPRCQERKTRPKANPRYITQNNFRRQGRHSDWLRSGLSLAVCGHMSRSKVSRQQPAGVLLGKVTTPLAVTAADDTDLRDEQGVLASITNRRGWCGWGKWDGLTDCSLDKILNLATNGAVGNERSGNGTFGRWKARSEVGWWGWDKAAWQHTAGPEVPYLRSDVNCGTSVK